MGEVPKALVIRTAGTNCEAEMCRAFESGGATAELVHVDRLIAEPGRMAGFDLIGFPGGFSYGDDIASGRILAMKLRERLWEPLRDAAARGVPMIGACNGFQVMVQVGLLPGPADGDWSKLERPQRSVALAHNQGGRFIDRWVGVRPAAESPCIWTRPLLDLLGPAGREVLLLPIAHGEGRVVAESGAVIDALRERGQIALTYTDNPNGSTADIAGICDVTGRIFGLMPHPERYLEWTLHPYWTRLDAGLRRGSTPGALMFRAAVEAAVAARV
ncbi:MAG: phosphoribosylformylglycinamidine synthase subunit PurQ [Phycisphaerales bacterium]